MIREYIRQLKAQGRAPTTIRIYQTDLVTFARFLTRSEQDVTEMGLPLLQAYCAYLTEQGYVRSSVSRQLTALKGFLRYLREQGVLERAQMPPPRFFITKTPKSLPPHLSQKEVNRLIEAPDNVTLWGIRDRAILEILYGTAVRVSELVGLDVSGWNQNTRRAMATILPVGPGQLNLAPLEVTTVYLNVPLRTIDASFMSPEPPILSPKTHCMIYTSGLA